MKENFAWKKKKINHAVLRVSLRKLELPGKGFKKKRLHGNTIIRARLEFDWPENYPWNKKPRDGKHVFKYLTKKEHLNKNQEESIRILNAPASQHAYSAADSTYKHTLWRIIFSIFHFLYVVLQSLSVTLINNNSRCNFRFLRRKVMTWAVVEKGHFLFKFKANSWSKTV